MNFVTFLCCILSLSFVINAQTFGSADVSESIKQLKQLEFLEGEWEGMGWRMSEKGERLYVKSYEKVKYKLGGSVMVIEGLGKVGDEVVHDALAFVKYDSKKKKIVIQTFIQNGSSLEMSPEVSENKLVWGFKIPNVGETRFTVIRNEKGNWFEIGEFSRDDGKTWMKTLEMELSKVGSKKSVENLEAKRTAAMKKLDFLVGDWEGKGWIIKQSGRQTFTIKESMKPKLDGQIVVVDGLGKSKDEKSGKEKIVHQAYGVFSYDADEDKIKFRWYKADGGEEGETYPDFAENKMIWKLDVPEYNVTTKFTEVITKEGNWLEIGEASRDGGKTWFKFFEMELSKVSD